MFNLAASGQRSLTDSKVKIDNFRQFSLSGDDLMLFFIKYHEILHYLHVGEGDYLNLLKDAKENDYPLPKRLLIKHEQIDTAILYTLINSDYE